MERRKNTIGKKEGTTMKKQIYILAAFMICGIALAACSDKDNDDNIVNNPDPANVETESTPSLPQSYTLTIKATKGSDVSLSKALALDGSTLNAAWESGETVKVYNGGNLIGTLTAQSNGTTTTLSGDNLTPAPTAGDELALRFNAKNYKSQDGTLEYISQNCDYATATVTVKEVTADGKITINETSADFVNQQAIVKFTLKSGDANVMATSLQVNDYTITPSSARNVYYVAIPAVKKIKLIANDGTDTYTFYKADANFANGKYYAINVNNLEKVMPIADGAVLTGTLGDIFDLPPIASGATVTLNAAKIKSAITCEGNATIILEGKNSINGPSSLPSIYIPKGATLTIDGTGKLSAASIGGGEGMSCGNIIINGGKITVQSGVNDGRAGIGSGKNASCGDITINGGTIIATGSYYCAGIGSGYDRSQCGNITINGGDITATGGINKDRRHAGGAGIGSGGLGSRCGDITINGGIVNAIGGDGYTVEYEGAGIGSGGYTSSCGNITITKNVTQVTAQKGNLRAESIGAGGGKSTCGSITIEEGANVIQK